MTDQLAVLVAINSRCLAAAPVVIVTVASVEPRNFVPDVELVWIMTVSVVAERAEMYLCTPPAFGAASKKVTSLAIAVDVDVTLMSEKPYEFTDGTEVLASASVSDCTFE